LTVRKHLHRIIDDERTQTGCGKLEHLSCGAGANRRLILQKPNLEQLKTNSNKERQIVETVVGKKKCRAK
jgi:hypothetical protein